MCGSDSRVRECVLVSGLQCEKVCVSVQDERACVSECRVSKCVVVSGVQGERDCVSVCVCVFAG